MTYKEAETKAAAYDAKLMATDPRFRRCCRVILDDGSIFMWDSAFSMLIQNDTYEGVFWAVFTEHHRFYVYDVHDVVEICQYEQITADDSVEKL